MSAEAEDAREEIQLFDGDGVSLRIDQKAFLFGCCDCGLVHNITVDRQPEHTVLRFHRVNKKQQ